ncbi:DUF3307 domain-containing protein [Roseinatronobacter sp.]|uniref:DUF3307 domain-containing protein n=1 Tax=Roseinatronobacter sp. TaxID=1945755 RepID=UPI0025F1001E|nr:DUF3307 domain-containing protein [Roseibaca sp.]
MTSADLLLIIAGLQSKHFAADFLLQTKRMRNEKGRYGYAGGVWHGLVHVAGSALILLPVMGFSSLIVAVLVGEGLAHYHIDWAKERIVRRRSLGVQSNDFWRLFGLDQLAHQLTYLVMVFVLVA